jgi:ABC-type glycerol-3-phosphate transport system substrate-binding protein
MKAGLFGLYRKRIVSVALVAVLAIASAGCGGGGSQGDTGVAELLAGEIKGEITVSCFNTMFYERFLNEAAALFESEFPETKVNIQTFASMPETLYVDMGDDRQGGVMMQLDEQEEVDYRYGLNTQLMSGQGPDILAMDVLPYHRYADSGMLEDLRAFMDADESFHMDDYRRNIIESARYKGGQFLMPLDFDFWHVIFDKDKIGGDVAIALRSKDRFSYPELIELVKAQFAADDSGARMIDLSGDEARAFRNIWQLDYNAYIDLENKKANFTDGAFVDMLKTFDEQRRSGYFQPVFQTMEEEFQDVMENGGLYYYKYNFNISLKPMFMPRGGDSPREWPGQPDIDEIAGLLTSGDGKAGFRTFQSYGMNANSQNKALAWAFIKFIIGEEMQQSRNILGLPVNNAAYIDKAKLGLVKIPNYVMGENNSYTIDGFQDNTDAEYVQAYEDYLVCLNGFVDMLNYFPITDNIISEMVRSEAELFFDGTKSAEDVAETLQNKVQLYLDE